MCLSLDQWLQVVVAGGTIALAIVAFWSLRQSHKHNQRILEHNQRILEEMTKAYKPILRVNIDRRQVSSFGNSSKSSKTYLTSLIFDNVGSGVAIDVKANYGFVTPQSLTNYPKAIESINVSPALSKDDRPVSREIKEPPGEADYCYVELLCKGASGKKHFFYFSIDTEMNTVKPITQDDYLKMKAHLVCPAK